MPVSYKQRDLRNTGTTAPPLAPLTGGKIAKRDRVLSAFANCDRLLGNTRRTIGRVGLHSSEKFQVGSVSPASGGTQVYPTATAERVALRVKYQPTPGCFPMFSALVNPSGMSQVFNTPTWQADIVFGQIKVTVSFVGAGLETVSWLLPLPVSGEVWGGEKQEAGAAWASLTRVQIPLLAPAGIKAAAVLHGWSECTSADIEVAYIGGCRVVDAVITEVPLGYCRELLSDTVYSSTVVTDASGKIVQDYPTEYPVDERNGVNPTFGSDNLANVFDRQHYRLGPILAQWSAWTEASQGVAATEAAPVTATSMSYADLLNSTITDWSATNPGWSLSSGGTAQQFRSSNAKRETRNKNACIPVRVWLWCWRTGTTDATIRLISEHYSVAELTVGSATPGWRSVTGFLRCGLGAEDASVLTLLGKVGNAADTLSVAYMIAEAIDL